MPDEQPIHSDDPEAMPHMVRIARPDANAVISKYAKRGLVGGVVVVLWPAFVFAYFAFLNMNNVDNRGVRIFGLFLGGAWPGIGMMTAIWSGIAWIEMARARYFYWRHAVFASIGTILGAASVALSVFGLLCITL